MSHPVTTPGGPIGLVRQFRRLRALVIGDAMLDTYLEGTAARLCSEGPVPVVCKTAEHRIPGGAANTAVNLRALDADVIFLGFVGCDLAGSLLRKALRAHGVSDRWLVEDAKAATLHKLRILADGQYVARFDEGGNAIAHSYSKESQQRIIANLETAYARCDLVVVSDYYYGALSDALIERLRELHEANPKTLVIDSKALQHFRAVKATVVTPNYQEARLLVELNETRSSGVALQGMRTLEEVERIGWQLLTLLDTEHVAVTLAEKGVFLLNRRGDAWHLPAHPVAHANDVGAGDSFASALALALAAGGSIDEAAQIGIDAAGIAVTKQWTAAVQYQELLQRVSVRAYASNTCSFFSLPHDSQGALSQVVAYLDAQRLAGRTIVFTNGVFDILHAGHVQLLRQAKELGDVLVVGVNSDRSTRRIKGAGRPINGERDRMALVAALDVVDHVVLFDEDTPTELIRALRPHIHVKGGDYADEALPEAVAVHEVGGRVVILPLIGSVSTSGMIERIAALATRQSSIDAASGGGKR
ncbi:MAG TPA: D-glycero-beta-D-manno-heptose 1-phosphate adenylyltransferase [Ktedonobacteraceae bacterium]|nr:D-glycero-beta-D-manno-heptose 1-phosphate adenylyltransferase [Ktedonobacteraceae bacterium]